jgi:hypothetical protein
MALYSKNRKCFFQSYVSRLDAAQKSQKSLLDEVKGEAEKFGEDIKHLADFTSGVKKFEPWIAKAEAKKAQGMAKPKNLQEAVDLLADATVIDYCDFTFYIFYCSYSDKMLPLEMARGMRSDASDAGRRERGRPEDDAARRARPEARG